MGVDSRPGGQRLGRIYLSPSRSRNVLPVPQQQGRNIQDVAQAQAWPDDSIAEADGGLKYFDYDTTGPSICSWRRSSDDMIDNYSMQVKYREPLLLFTRDDHKTARRPSDQADPLQKFFAGPRFGGGGLRQMTGRLTFWWATRDSSLLLKIMPRRETIGSVSNRGCAMQSRRNRRQDSGRPPAKEVRPQK